MYFINFDYKQTVTNIVHIGILVSLVSKLSISYNYHKYWRISLYIIKYYSNLKSESTFSQFWEICRNIDEFNDQDEIN